LGRRSASGVLHPSHRFSILSYLVILHFLLGKSRRPVDLETAELAKTYAEYHLESTLLMMREYGSEQRGQICKVTSLRETMLGNGAAKVTVRDIQRRLSRKLLVPDVFSSKVPFENSPAFRV